MVESFERRNLKSFVRSVAYHDIRLLHTHIKMELQKESTRP